MSSVLILAYGPTRVWGKKVLETQTIDFLLTLNNAERAHPRTTHHFDIHSPKHHVLDTLPDHVVRVIHHNEKPGLFEQAFPINAVRKLIFPNQDLHLGGTLCFMIAYALTSLSADRLFLAGCDFMPEYAKAEEKEAVMFWLGVASTKAFISISPRSRLNSKQDYK